MAKKCHDILCKVPEYGFKQNFPSLAKSFVKCSKFTLFTRKKLFKFLMFLFKKNTLYVVLCGTRSLHSKTRKTIFLVISPNNLEEGHCKQRTRNTNSQFIYSLLTKILSTYGAFRPSPWFRVSCLWQAVRPRPPRDRVRPRPRGPKGSSVPSWIKGETD